MLDYEHTIVLLIGASIFPHDLDICSIPNVEVNLEQFKRYLIDEKYIGIPHENIIISLNENKIQIEKHLRNIAELTSKKKHSLIIYYSGHGLLSAREYKLYLSTSQTSRKYLEIEGINIDEFKKYIRYSNAGTKIIILDCCHSGAIVGMMNGKKDLIQTNLQGFEGTYIMASAPENEPAMFPSESPNKPTFFTGRLLEIIEKGLEIDSDYCSMREIFIELESFCRENRLPIPQQYNLNRADEVLFCKNNNYGDIEHKEERDFYTAELVNTVIGYQNFMTLHPFSAYAPICRGKINELEEHKLWTLALKKNRIQLFRDYLKFYPNGKFANEATNRLDLLCLDENITKESIAIERDLKIPVLNQQIDCLGKERGKEEVLYAETIRINADNINDLNLEKKKVFSETQKDDPLILPFQEINHPKYSKDTFSNETSEAISGSGSIQGERKFILRTSLKFVLILILSFLCIIIIYASWTFTRRPFHINTKSEGSGTTGSIKDKSAKRDSLQLTTRIFDSLESIKETYNQEATKGAKGLKMNVQASRKPEPEVYGNPESQYLLYCEYNSSVFKMSSLHILDSLSQIMRSTNGKLLLKGYYSSDVSKAYSKELSLDMANSAKVYLVNSGISSSRIKTYGYGSERPLAPSNTEDGRYENRRVECILIK